VIFAPATLNSINKLALGIADNYALTRVTAAMAAKIRVVIIPFAGDFDTPSVQSKRREYKLDY